jgi:hypothetical protein
MVAFAILFAQTGLLAAVDSISAREIMERNFFVSKILSMRSDASMLLTNDKGQVRERKISILSKLQSNGVDSKLIMKFNSPADIKGIGFLQIEHVDADDDQWIYLPALKKSRRLVANNKKDSFMGSDFSYGDFTRSKVDTYKHKLLRSVELNGRDCYLIESIPRDETIRNDSGYSRKVTWVAKDNFLEVKVDYYDLSGELLKTQMISNHKLLEPGKNRWFAMRREMVNHQTGHKTLLTFAQLEAGIQAPEDMFTTRNLERL